VKKLKSIIAVNNFVHMKISSLVLLILVFSCAGSRTAGLEISANGVERIKIGMKKTEVEKALGAPLAPYIASNSSMSDPDSIVTTWGCANCTTKYTCEYNTVTLLLTFFRYTLYKQTDYELAAISAVPPSSLFHTKSGIKVGISEKEFIEICKKNNYPYNEMPIDDNHNGYLFTDELHEHSAKALMAKFSNGNLINLIVIHMIGD
jgi:hypothetical protein